MNTQMISLDLAKKSSSQQVTIAQGDVSGTTIVATIYDSGTKLAETDITAFFVMELPDGRHYVRDSAEYADGVITYTVNENHVAAVDGYTDNAYFELHKGVEVASTERFTVIIAPSAYDGHEPSDDWDNAIYTAINAVNAAANQASSAASTATSATDSANSAADRANAAANQASSAASTATSATDSANSAADRANAAANQASSAASTATSATDSANSAADRANAAAESAESVVAGAVATPTTAGVMSAADKAKLDGIEDNANAYVLPQAADSVLGGIKVGANFSIADDGTLNQMIDSTPTPGSTHAVSSGGTASALAELTAQVPVYAQEGNTPDETQCQRKPCLVVCADDSLWVVR